MSSTLPKPPSVTLEYRAEVRAALIRWGLTPELADEWMEELTIMPPPEQEESEVVFLRKR